MRPTAQFGSPDRQAAFRALMEQYEPALWRLINSYEADPSGREDLFQEIALGLWEAIPRFRHESSERTWLYRIAHNIAISAMVSRRRRSQREVPWTNSTEGPTAGDPPDRAILLDQKRRLMLAAIHGLPGADRQIIVLHLEGLSYEEIEDVSGLSQSAIATRLSRIRDRLSQAVQKGETGK
jgi:RNA polymerase sigma-70 factor (ECF subfamily)